MPVAMVDVFGGKAKKFSVKEDLKPAGVAKPTQGTWENGREVEVKFTITGKVEIDQVSALNLDGYRLKPGGLYIFEDTLLDTVERRLTAQKCGLRVRRSKNKTILTFKVPAPQSGRKGWHIREEVEAEIAPELLTDREKWPEIIQARLLPLIGDDPLLPLFTIENRRFIWDVEKQGKYNKGLSFSPHTPRVAELVLDTAVIRAGVKTLPLKEMEIELKEGGTLADLDALGKQLSLRLPLDRERRGKRSRGLALLAQS